MKEMIQITSYWLDPNTNEEWSTTELIKGNTWDEVMERLAEHDRNNRQQYPDGRRVRFEGGTRK